MFPGLAILFWLVARLALLVGGVVLVASGLRRPRDRRRVLGGGAVLAVLALSVLIGTRTSVEEWNPRVPPAAMPGEWAAGASRLRLMPDGGYTLRVEGDVLRRIGVRQSTGRWSLDDWDLHLVDDGGRRIELRVVVIAGGLRILEDPGDLDGWRAWGGFARVPTDGGKR